MRRARARPVRACFFPDCCAAVQEQDLRATRAQCNAKGTLSSLFALHSSHPALHTSHLHSSHPSSSHLISCLLICQLSSSWLFSLHLSTAQPAACSHFTQKNTRFRAPASSPTQVPCQMNAAITMHFAAPRTHPCSHYNAILIPALQNTKGEPITRWNDPSRTCTRPSHSRPPLHARSVPLNGQGHSGRRQVCLAFRTWPGGYGQGIVRRNISPEACRDLVEARMLAERMERSFSEHCSQVLFRIPPVLLLQPQMYWAPCTCVAAVGTWTRWPPAGALGPHAPFRAHPVPFRSCWCLPRAGQGVQGVVRYNILAPCPVPRRPGSVHDLFWRGHKAARGVLPPPRLGGGRGLARRRRPLGPAPHGPRSGLDTPGRHNPVDPLGLSHYLSIN